MSPNSRRAEQALQRLNEELEQRVNAALAERRLFAELVDHSVVNVHVVDKDLRWLAVNRQARHDFHLLYGRTPEIGDYLPGLFEDGTAGQTPILPMWQRAWQASSSSRSAPSASPRGASL